MRKTYSLAGIITHLHREPGIDFDTDPDLYEAANTHREALKQHFALEGLDLRIDHQIQAIGLAVIPPERLERMAAESGHQAFQPIYNALAEDHWSSVLLVLLALRYQSSVANPNAAWMSESELFSEFNDYHDEENRLSSGKTLELMRRKLKALRNKGLLKEEQPKGREPHYTISKWFLLRITDDEIDAVHKEIADFLERGDQDQDASGSKSTPAANDLFSEMFSEAQSAGENPEDSSEEFLSTLMA